MIISIWLRRPRPKRSLRRAGGPMVEQPTRHYDYLRDPTEIYRRSFAAIRGEADFSAVPPDGHNIAVRMIRVGCCFREARCVLAANGRKAIKPAKLPCCIADCPSLI